MSIKFTSEDEEIIEKWFLTRNLSTGTQQNYLIALKNFSDLIGKTPKELYEEADAEEEKGVRPIKSKAYHYMLKFKRDLLENTRAPNTVKYKFATIKSFYKALGITLPDIKMDHGDIGLEENQGKSLSKEDVKKLADAANSRERALIYLMAHSGMAQQEARDLTLKKYLDAASNAINRPLDNVHDLFKFEKEVLQEILTLNITRKKVKYNYITFIPPEASREIINYLKERCNGRNEKIRVNGNNDYIFSSKYGGQLSSDSVITNFRRIGEKAGFKRDKNVYSYWRSHSLRKYFISTIINKGGDKIIADFMAGHKINNQDRTYWKANPEDLKQQYIQILPYLSIDKVRVKDVETKEFKTLMEDSKKKDKKIKAVLEDSKKKDERLKEMEERLDAVKELEERVKAIERYDESIEKISNEKYMKIAAEMSNNGGVDAIIKALGINIETEAKKAKTKH